MLLKSSRWLLILVCLLCTACGSLGLLAVNIPASFGQYTRYRDIAYAEDQRNKLDVYLPAHPQHAPIVVFIHGGGWNNGDKAQYKFVGVALAQEGWIAVLPDYRLYPDVKYPAFVADAARAVAWARVHAGDYGGNTERLYLMGHSAGAQIAMMLALDSQYLAAVGGSPAWLHGVIGLAGPYDFLPFTRGYMHDLFGPPERFAASQPINYVTTQAPPTLLIHGMKDTTVFPKNTRNLYAALMAVDAKSTVKYYDKAAHSDLIAALSPLARGRADTLADIREFIRRDF